MSSATISVATRIHCSWEISAFQTAINASCKLLLPTDVVQVCATVLAHLTRSPAQHAADYRLTKPCTVQQLLRRRLLSHCALQGLPAGLVHQLVLPGAPLCRGSCTPCLTPFVHDLLPSRLLALSWNLVAEPQPAALPAASYHHLACMSFIRLQLQRDEAAAVAVSSASTACACHHA